MDSQENNIVENQLHRSVLLDHEMVVDGVILRERKELNNVTDDESNQVKSIPIHTRFIGDKKYEVQQVAADDDIVEEIVETDLSDEEIGKFKEEWEDEDSSGDDDFADKVKGKSKTKKFILETSDEDENFLKHCVKFHKLEKKSAVEDSQGPSSATEGTTGSVDCIGCSNAEDENEVCPSPIQAKVKQKKTFEALFHELWTKIGAWEYGAYPPTPTPEQEEIDLDVCTDHNVGQTDIDSITPVSKRKRIYTEKEYDDKCQENASLRDDLASAQKRLKVLEHAAVRPKPRKKRTAQLEE